MMTTATLSLTDLLALPAGRELDCAIFELRYKDKFTSGEYEAGDGGYYRLNAIERARVERLTVERVSGEMTYAWPLLAEMLAAGVSIVLMPAIRGKLNLIARVPTWSRIIRPVIVPTLADAPLAICRAWATWKMGGGA